MTVTAYKSGVNNTTKKKWSLQMKISQKQLKSLFKHIHLKELVIQK